MEDNDHAHFKNACSKCLKEFVCRLKIRMLQVIENNR